MKKKNYKLSGVIHYISFGKKIGHYTASSKCNGEWFYFDDTIVSKAHTLNSNEIILFYDNGI